MNPYPYPYSYSVRHQPRTTATGAGDRKVYYHDDGKLHKLCHDGNLNKVKKFVEKFQDGELAEKLSNRKGVFGYTPLHEAVASGKAEVLDFVLRSTGNTHVNCKANSGYTPLHLAASSGHRDCVKTLLEHGADIAIIDEYGKTPKQTAELSSKGSIVRLLRSEEIIKEVENNGDKLTELLKNSADQLEPNCLPRALKAATSNDSHHNIGKLIVKGASNLEECMEIALVEKKPHSRAMLLLVKAGITGNKSIIQKLFGDAVSNPGSLDPREFNDDQFAEVQQAVLSGKVSTVVPIEIARRHGNNQVREELLLKTDVNQEEGSVFWHGLRLLSLDISWLRRINWVKRLRLARNGFKSLPQEMGTYMKQVVKLDLQHNDLSQIPRCLLELPSLGELNLAHNSLEEIPDVVEWSPCLTVLDLSYNQLSSMPINVIAPAIRALNLSHNQFQQVPLCICSFTTLHSLNLSENQDILQLPAEMGRLNQLSRLGLSGLKDLNDPPRNLLKDPRDCIRYLNSKLRCAKGFYKMKLMVVGRVNIGKTTLVARLQGKDCGNEATLGVDVSEWWYKPSLEKNKFQFCIWDFSGFEEYYATHQCFLSERSLYLLLFNLKHGENGVQELKPWLNNIALRAPNSLVIIVGTHLDEVGDEERAEVDQILQSAGSLASAYTNKLKIAEILPVGLMGRIENIGLLKDAIYNHAASYTTRRGQPIMGQKIPASYHTLDKRLEGVQEEVRRGDREPIMHTEQFKSMVLQMNLPDMHDDEELKTATLFLTDIGTLLHYDDRSHNLNELYFIDPQWLCAMMEKVVTFRERNPFLKKGILHIKNIPLLFMRDKRFLWDRYEQYLALLDRFEIALPLDNKRVLVPSMLPAIRPKEVDEEYQELLKKPLYTRFIIFTQATTPPGFWSRLLSRIMHSVQKVTAALDKTSPAEYDAQTPSFSAPQDLSFSSTQPSSFTSEPESFPSNMSLPESEPPSSLPSIIPPEVGSPSDGIHIFENFEPGPPTISGPMPASDTDLNLTLPNFAPALPISLEDAYAPEDIKMYYWREGVFYKDPSMMFRIESLTSSQHSRREKGDGVLLSSSPTNEGKQIVGQLVDIVLALVNEWYPGLNESTHGGGIEQRVPCFECIKQRIPKPFEFLVEQCLTVIARNETTMECGYYRNEPAKNHTVKLTDIVPDLLLQDIDAKFLLNKEDIIYEEDDASLLGRGGYGKVYRGKCHGKAVAIKKYLTRNEEAFSELRSEAKLLQQSHHPCFVCLEGVCVYPMMALVLELAPLGALSFPLLKKKIPIHRLTIFRIALEVAAALRFVHKQGIVFRDLKADNVLLWTLNPDSLCHCKITDFGIATHLSPVGAKGLQGTKGFIAPEVLHVGKRKQRSAYDHKADTFSFAMFLYQMITRRHPYHDIAGHMIDASVESGERPKLLDVDYAHFAYYYLTKLMETCWMDKATYRPDDDVIMKKLSLSAMQSTMAATPIKSRFSLRKAIAITPTDFTEAGVLHRLYSELWVCCDGAEGAEINMYNTHTMAKVNKNFIKDNQVQAIIKCSNHVWIGSRAGIEYGVVDIFSIQTKELVHNLGMRENSVSCMACTSDAVYIGTLEGYCFRFVSDIEQVRSNAKPRYRYVSENAVDGIACTQQCVWASHTRYIYFMNFDTLHIEGSIHQENVDTYIGQLSPSPDGKTIWSAHLGGFLLTAWDAHSKSHCFDVDTSEHMAVISSDIPEKDRIMTAMVPAEDCVWVGMATGHILVFSENELLTWFHPYTEYVPFLTVIPCSGPCEMEKCMVVSGGEGFQSMVEDLDHTVAAKVDEKGHIQKDVFPSDQVGYLVVWEAFCSKTYRQLKLIGRNVPEMFDNHLNVSLKIREGGFVDGTNILKTSKPDDISFVPESSSSTDIYTPDLDAQPYHDANFDSRQSSLEGSTTGFGASNTYDITNSIRHRDSNFFTDSPQKTGIPTNMGVSLSQTPTIPEESSFDSGFNGPIINSVMPASRQRAATIVSSSVSGASDAVFDIKLLSTEQIVRITCPSPPQLKVVLSELQVNATVNEDNCKLVYFNAEKEVRLKTQEHFQKYLALKQKPQLFLTSSEKLRIPPVVSSIDDCPSTSSRASNQKLHSGIDSENTVDMSTPASAQDTYPQADEIRCSKVKDHSSTSLSGTLQKSDADHEQRVSSKVDADFSSLQNLVKELKQQLQFAEQKAQDAAGQEQATQLLLGEANNRCKNVDERLAEALSQEKISRHLLQEANHRHGDIKRQLTETTDKLFKAEQLSQDARQQVIAAKEWGVAAKQRALTAEQRVAEADLRIEELTADNHELGEDLQHLKKRVQELMADKSRLSEDLQDMERRAQLAEQKSHDLETQWVVHRREIQMTERELGGGGWGVVKVAKFRGIQVAAKSLYEQIRSDYYGHLFIREMNMAARLRHPNLVQFIGATLEGEMIILTEIMDTSLRRVLEQGGISREHTVSISVQVCQALNYLHLMRPDPVIHRDISSANVLLNPLPDNGWLAKVTDYGSVNTLRTLKTENPGNPVYAAPEAKVPSLQSTKMDIFSVGVLLIEMCTGQFPSDDGREHLLYSIKDRPFIVLIKKCINGDKDKRPTSSELIHELHQVLV